MSDQPRAPGGVDRAVARRAIDAKTKPLGALGRLEDLAVRLAVLQGTLSPEIDRARVCVFAADHGVVAEGVSAYPRSVTGEMMRNFDRGGAAINVIAAASGVDVEVIDVGVDADLEGLTRVRSEKVRRGSRNMVEEAAMSADELNAAFAVGAAAAKRAVSDGVRALGLGEMGIGNTTAAAALLAALTGQPPAMTVGRGTGVDDETLTRKCAVVERALRLHHGVARFAADGTRESLRCVGGLELAAIAGAALEAMRWRTADVADGFISTISILCAARIALAEALVDDRTVGESLFFAHRSAERGHGLALDTCAVLPGCDARPILDLDMRLGEGSGAALAIPVLRAAAAIMRDMATFRSAGVSAGDQAVLHA
jgi:nicotinate-nucleotide--dimethylbenzimidazole phosphoribosyltransferase